MSNNLNRHKHIQAAMDAQTTLAVFAAVAAILESGAIHGKEPAAVRKIIKICQDEQQRQLSIMDEAMEYANVQ
jgi:hypothetical protein